MNGQHSSKRNYPMALIRSNCNNFHQIIPDCVPTPSRSNSVPAPPQSFRFLDLPAELRDNVLRKCVQAGNLEIIQTSQEVHGWSRSLIKRYAIFRLAVLEQHNTFSTSPTAIPPSAVMASNFRVHISLGLLYHFDTAERFDSLEHLPPLIDQTAARKNCQVIIKCTTICPNNSPYDTYTVRLPTKVIGALRSFLKFEILTIEVGFYSGIQDSIVPVLWTAAYCGLVAQTKNKPFYELLKQSLEDYLGPATWQDGYVRGGRVVEFRPKKFWRDRLVDAVGWNDPEVSWTKAYPLSRSICVSNPWKQTMSGGDSGRSILLIVELKSILSHFWVPGPSDMISKVEHMWSSTESYMRQSYRLRRLAVCIRHWTKYGILDALKIKVYALPIGHSRLESILHQKPWLSFYEPPVASSKCALVHSSNWGDSSVSIRRFLSSDNFHNLADAQTLLIFVFRFLDVIPVETQELVGQKLVPLGAKRFLLPKKSQRGFELGTLESPKRGETLSLLQFNHRSTVCSYLTVPVVLAHPLIKNWSLISVYI